MLKEGSQDLYFGEEMEEQGMVKAFILVRGQRIPLLSLQGTVLSTNAEAGGTTPVPTLTLTVSGTVAATTGAATRTGCTGQSSEVARIHSRRWLC